MWPALIGGIGVFLLGMGLLTDGLKQWAGDGLRRFLERFAGNRFSAAATGIVATAFIQSSSATSLITIGLVGAGLIALPNAIAILIGANVGTTATAYLVAFIGLKVSISAYALPLIGLGAFMRLFVQGRLAAIASAVAGFGLLFLGIDLMRGAIGDLATQIDISAWAGGGLLGAVLLVGVGIAMTVLVQSSSAAMATTLTTLDAGIIDLQEAAFLAIGQNIGTTVTAVVGSLGGSVMAKRTAAAHVAFNLGTAIPALALVVPLLAASNNLAGGDAVAALAYFHTMFNLLGMVIFLPLVAVLARGLERILPQPANPLVSPLDRAALQTAGAAEAAVDAALVAIVNETAHLLRSRLQTTARAKDWVRRLQAVHEAVARTRQFMETARAQGHLASRIVMQLRALDHLQHMLKDLHIDVSFEADTRRVLAPFLTRFTAALHDLQDADDADLAGLTKVRKTLRSQVLQRVEADTAFGPEDARRHLEALHWVDRMAWHLRRVLQSVPMRPTPDQPL